MTCALPYTVASRPTISRTRRSPARRSWKPAVVRRPRWAARSSATRSASSPTATGVPVDAQLRAGERLWAVGDVTGLWPLTHDGKYQGDVVAANNRGEPREAHYEAVPRVVFTDPQAGGRRGRRRFTATAPVSDVAKTATYSRAYANDDGLLTLL